MIKVKLIEKTKDKSGDLKRVPKSEKEIKKNKNYNSFISEISKAFSIPKNKFVLKVLTEDDDDYAINDQEDLDSYIKEAREFLIIMEEGSEKTKSSKKAKEEEMKNDDSDKDDDKNDNDNNKDGDEKKDDEEEEEDGYLKKINIKVNLEMSEQEIENIMNSVKIPEIDEINDEVEFNIEKYKEDLNNMNNTKIGNFKKSFEDDINNIIKQKSTIIKQNISQLVLNNQKEQNKNLESIDEEISSVKKDFDEIIKNTSEMNNAIGDLNFRITGERNEFSDIKVEIQNDLAGANDMILDEVEEDFENKDKNIIKFENEEIRHEISIKNAKFFYIENIIITNINGNKGLDPLYFSIDTSRSPKDLLFFENSRNTTNHRLTLNGPLQKGEKLTNIVAFHFDNPKIGEHTIFIYVKEKPNTENLSKPLKIIIKITEDPEDKKKREEAEKMKKEEEEKKRKEEEENKRKEEEEKRRKEEEENKRKEEEEKKRKEEEEKKRKEEEEKKRKEEEENKRKEEEKKKEGQGEIKNDNEVIDYQGQDKNKVDEMFNELENEYNISSIFDKEKIYKIIIEFNCDRAMMNKWIEDNL